MSFFNFDEKQVETRSFEPLPVGEYEVIISKVEPGVSSQKKTPQIATELTVRDDVDQPGKKRKIFHTLYFTPNTVQMNMSFLAALGLTGQQNFATIEDFAKAIVYKPLRVKIKHEEYENNQGETKTRERVHYVLGSQHIYSGGQPTADPFAVPTGGGVPSDDDLPF
jgi:hypothetical protein